MTPLRAAAERQPARPAYFRQNERRGRWRPRLSVRVHGLAL